MSQLFQRTESMVHRTNRNPKRQHKDAFTSDTTCYGLEIISIRNISKLINNTQTEGGEKL